MLKEIQKILRLTMVDFTHSAQPHDTTTPSHLHHKNFCDSVNSTISSFLSFNIFFLAMTEDLLRLQAEAKVEPCKKEDLVNYESDEVQDDTVDSDKDQEKGEEETIPADLGGGWGRIIFSPVRRGRQVAMDVCRSIKRDGSEGSFQHLVFTRSKNPTLHRLAKKSLWGDLWPF